MKFLKHIPLEKIKAFIFEHQRIFFLAMIGLLISGIYIFSKNADEKVISYHKEDHSDFTESRVINNGGDIYQKREKALSVKFEELEKQIKELHETISHQKEKTEILENEVSEELPQEREENIKPSPATYPEPQIPYEAKRIESVSLPTLSSNLDSSNLAETAPLEASGPSIISFPVKTKIENSPMVVTIPSGSFVKAKLLTGVEAAEGKALPVLLQADFAFVGPNKSRIDLSGCFLIAKSTGNLSIERIEMQASKISCVSKTGRMFERELNGFVADNKDNAFAVMGAVNSKQDRVASMAFLASVISGISGAIGQAQTTTATNPMGGSTFEITGDQQKYIAAQGAGNAANIVTQWYLKHAQSLLPTINVGSGQDVWIIVQDSVDLPNWYFKKQDTKTSGFEFLSKLTE